MERIAWKAYCHDNRHEGIRKIEQQVSQFGDIVDFKMFSDIAINFIIEIQARKLDGLYQHLGNLLVLEGFTPIRPESKKECVLFLNVTFTKGSGELKVEVPNVPG